MFNPILSIIDTTATEAIIVSAILSIATAAFSYMLNRKKADIEAESSHSKTQTAEFDSLLGANKGLREELRLELNRKDKEFQAYIKNIAEQSETWKNRVTILEGKIAELTEKSRYFERIINLSPIGIFTADSKGNYLYINEEYSRISGLSRENVMGNGWRETVFADDEKRVVEEFNNSISLQIPFKTKHYCINRVTGKKMLVLRQARPEYGIDGRVSGFLGTLVDLSDICIHPEICA